MVLGIRLEIHVGLVENMESYQLAHHNCNESPPWPLSEALFPINGTFFFHLHENNMKTPRALKTELVELFAFPTNMPLTSLDQEFQPHFKKFRLNIYQIRKVKKKKRKKKPTHVEPKATISPLYTTHNVPSALYSTLFLVSLSC
jgi:hypothetical protein